MGVIFLVGFIVIEDIVDIDGIVGEQVFSVVLEQYVVFVVVVLGCFGLVYQGQVGVCVQCEVVVLFEGCYCFIGYQQYCYFIGGNIVLGIGIDCVEVKECWIVLIIVVLDQDYVLVVMVVEYKGVMFEIGYQEYVFGLFQGGVYIVFVFYVLQYFFGFVKYVSGVLVFFVGLYVGCLIFYMIYVLCVLYGFCVVYVVIGLIGGDFCCQ